MVTSGIELRNCRMAIGGKTQGMLFSKFVEYHKANVVTSTCVFCPNISKSNYEKIHGSKVAKINKLTGHKTRKAANCGLSIIEFSNYFLASFASAAAASRSALEVSTETIEFAFASKISRLVNEISLTRMFLPISNVSILTSIASNIFFG